MNKTETSEKQLKETEISSPPDGLQYNDHKYAHQTQERINIVRTLRVRQKIQYQREVITKLKNTLEVLNSRVDEVEKRMSKLKDKMVGLAQTEQENEEF